MFYRSGTEKDTAVQGLPGVGGSAAGQEVMALSETKDHWQVFFRNHVELIRNHMIRLPPGF